MRCQNEVLFKLKWSGSALRMGDTESQEWHVAWDRQACPPCSWEMWNPQDPRYRGPAASMPCLEVGPPRHMGLLSRRWVGTG